MENIGEFYAYDVLTILLKFYWLTFEKNLKALTALGSCHVSSSRQGVNKTAIFEVFRAYLREFSISFHEIFMVIRSFGRHKNFA